MAVYQWKGIEGSKMSSGEIEALNIEDAGEKLKTQGIIVTNVVLISGTEQESMSMDDIHKDLNQQNNAQNQDASKKHKAKKISNKDLMVFTKKFATMVKAGLPILKTLKMLEEQQENPNFQWVVRTICSDVESGSTLSNAFSKFPTIFDTVYINMIKAGETSGKLTLFLEKLVVQIEKNEKIRAKVKSALSYPIILLCVAFVVIAIMLVKVVPVFQKMFKSMGHDLPGPTQLIINISEFCRDPAGGGVVFFLIAGSIIGGRYLIKNNISVKRKFDKLMLKIPVLGDIIEKSTLAKIAMVEGNLASAGVSVLESLDIIESTISSTVYKDCFAIIKHGVSSGNSLSSLYSSCEPFPPTFSQMLSVGEETGNMDEMFEATANYYEEEFDMTVDRLTELLEPFMIVFMGVTVGFIIVAMYMPIFQIGDMVS